MTYQLHLIDAIFNFVKNLYDICYRHVMPQIFIKKMFTSLEKTCIGFYNVCLNNVYYSMLDICYLTKVVLDFKLLKIIKETKCKQSVTLAKNKKRKREFMLFAKD
jgi:hypothetical protein